MSPNDDDIRGMMREFRVSVSAELDAMHRRLDEFADEIRSLGNRIDRRLERIESRLNDLEAA